MDRQSLEACREEDVFVDAFPSGAADPVDSRQRRSRRERIGRPMADELNRKVAPLPKWRLKKVRDYIERHGDESLQLADLALVAGLSRMHFAAQFRSATGYSPCQYLRVRRIERAKQILSREQAPLVQVALSVGFQAQAHFSSVFQRITGQSPGQWRRANRQASDDVAG